MVNLAVLWNRLAGREFVGNAVGVFEDWYLCSPWI